MPEAINNFGVDVEYVQTFLPNVPIKDDTSPNLDQAHLLITRASSFVNAKMQAVGITPSDVTQTDYPIQYEIVKDLIGLLATMYVARAAYNFNDEMVRSLKDEFDNKIKEFLRSPRQYLGVPPNNVAGDVETVANDWGITGVGSNARSTTSTTTYGNIGKWNFDTYSKGKW